MEIEIKRAVGIALGNISHDNANDNHGQRQYRDDPVENNGCRGVACARGIGDIQVLSQRFAI